MKPVIFGIAGPTLSADERAFFAETRPAGYILFRRNCVDPAQLRALTDSLRALEGRDDVAILIDQEGGPVARMQPPHWPAFPAGPAFDRLYEIAPMSAIEAARANAQALGLMLHAAGVTVNCLPLLDVARDGTTAAVATRTLGRDPLRVASLGRAVIDGLRQGGVVAVAKHMPGHGRALVDSHLSLPTVTADDAALEEDIAPFRSLADVPMGMTSHILYEAWDRERPATLSPTIIAEVIRGLIGFDGLLMSDDIDMKALAGTPADKAAGVIAAGCDVVLDCWARMDEMVAIADRLGEITPRGAERLAAAMATVAAGPEEGDMAALIAKRDELLAYA